ncbi:MAG: hypothetical protein ACKN9U_10565, partial [Pirellulaceae bacterium]
IAEDERCRVCSNKGLDRPMGRQIAMMSDVEIHRSVNEPEPRMEKAFVFSRSRTIRSKNIDKTAAG